MKRVAQGLSETTHIRRGGQVISKSVISSEKPRLRTESAFDVPPSYLECMKPAKHWLLVTGY